MFTSLLVLEANIPALFHYVSVFERKRKEGKNKEFSFFLPHWGEISGVKHVGLGFCYRRKAKLSAEYRYQFPVYPGILSYCRKVFLVAGV